MLSNWSITFKANACCFQLGHKATDTKNKGDIFLYSSIAPFYNEECKSKMDKFKSSILTDLYDCHNNYKDKFN